MIVLTVTQQTSGGTLVQTHETEVLHDPQGRAARSTLDVLGDLTLDLETNLDDLQRVGEDLEKRKKLLTQRKTKCSSSFEPTHHLTGTSSTSSQNLMKIPDLVGILIGKGATHEIVHGQLNGLLGSHANQLRDNTGVQAKETLVPDDLPRAVNGVVVEAFTRTIGPLVLHTGLDQVNGVDHESTERTRQTTQSKVMRRFQQTVQEVLGLGGRRLHRLTRNCDRDTP